MIVSFRHKGLRIFFESGSTKGIPGWRLHPLKGELEEFWSLTVNGNWRVIFRFVGSDIELVDYLDYH